jgi:hypothetical protein
MKKGFRTDRTCVLMVLMVLMLMNTIVPNERGPYKRPVRVSARFMPRPGIKLDCHFRGRAANFASILTVPCPNDDYFRSDNGGFD